MLNSTFLLVFFYIHIGAYAGLLLAWLIIGIMSLIEFLQDVHDCVNAYREVRDDDVCENASELDRKIARMFRKRGKK